MNWKKKEAPESRGLRQPFKRHGAHTPQLNPVAQLKKGLSALTVRPPVAPPVYRPQARPTAAQAKMAKDPGNGKRPFAPPVYRPQPVQKVLQTKSSLSLRPLEGQTARPPVRPPVYHSQPLPKVSQTKSAPVAAVAFSVPAVRSRFGVALQCSRHSVQQPQITPSRESLIQAASDLGLLSETVNDELGRSPTAVDTRELRYRLEQVRNLGRIAQDDIRYDRDLNPRLPQIYEWFLALLKDYERAVAAYRKSDRWLEEAIEQSNQNSFASNPLTGGLKPPDSW